ncbi:small GTP-binding protein, putative [Trichomonas vaginalis G3]|uniref:Small GTP-binding protein, putative n=1 Tax=Trichomonas vaginalis (strain ATCC PRA-98 / G3) TaxID=412133 RepID=A2E8I0_TRIV3|nr:GTPase protein [Trichomonas vaginalis G3]EAY11017.1 small GTP-binding protein, putative [Trichomonas vaginalis G3]KAI5531809.1 GTPase protein [Trichomonas vaginalis G3]|eukprot:XP_001323240.1 small GTP-binding protein [Trichomonas vaginalis G3]
MESVIDIPVFKVALIGRHSSGKTSIITSYHRGEFLDRTEPTIGANFVSHLVNFNDKKAELQLWDTAGQDKYRSICPLFYRDALCCIVVYDCTVQASFDSLDDYINDYHEYAISPGLIYIAANKSDLAENDTLIENGREYALKNNYPFFVTSAKTKEGIKELFEDIAEQLFLRNDEVERKERRPKASSKNCC